VGEKEGELEKGEGKNLAHSSFANLRALVVDLPVSNS